MQKEWIESYYAAYNSEDAEALRRFYADDVVLVSAQGELRGADAIIGIYQFITSQFYDRMTPLQIDIQGDRAIVTISDMFTAKSDVADFMGRSFKQGETFELRLRGTYTVVNGKFSRIEIENIV